MSHPLLPKNLNKDNALFRQGKPDYSKLKLDAFPVPTAAEAGAILENTDTGDRYRWTGTVWVMIGLEGQVRTAPSDYFVEVAQLNVPGAVDAQMQGRSLAQIGTAFFETLWDEGGDYTYLSAATTLYVSSDSASDIAVDVRLCGLDANHELIFETATTNGQTQVAFTGTILRVREVEVVNATSPVGNLYIAETDTLTAGKPNTASKIKSKIPLAPNEVGDFASTNITHNGFFTVPQGADVHLLNIIPAIQKNQDVQLDIRQRQPGGSWQSIQIFWSYNQPGPVGIIGKARLRQRTDIEMRVLSGSANGSFEGTVQLLLRDR